MSDDEAFGSDSSDEDYEPIVGEAVSEEEGSGDEEDATLLAKDAEEGDSDGKRSKKSKTKKEFGRGKRQGGIKLDDENVDQEEAKEEKVDFSAEEKKVKEQVKEIKEKKKSDDLWASFLSDVPGPTPKSKASVSSGMGSLSSVKKPSTAASATKAFSSPSASVPSTVAPAAKVTITKEYDFAGEKVKVTKEVDANSLEAKKEEKSEEMKAAEKPASGLPGLGMKRPGGGLGSLVGRLNKAPKISTLDKSKLDWESFKQDNKLTEELSTHNKGKEGFLERKAFLERSDLRQFEIEKSLRLSTSKR